MTDFDRSTREVKLMLSNQYLVKTKFLCGSYMTEYPAMSGLDEGPDWYMSRWL